MKHFLFHPFSRQVTGTKSELKHFKDGDFHKDYDRQLTFESLVGFLKNPTGDVAWKEEQSAKDVHHIEDAKGRKKM